MRIFKLNEKIAGLKEEVENLKGKDIILTSNYNRQVVRASNLEIELKTEQNIKKELQAKYDKLKEEAIDYHRDIMLESSLKIIGAVLKNKKPDNSWFNQQRAAQQRLSSLEGSLGYSDSPVGGLVRSLGL